MCAPGAAVVGELGWPPMSIEVRRLQLSLFGRFSSAGGADDGRTLASRVFNYAVHVPVPGLMMSSCSYNLVVDRSLLIVG